MSKRVRAGPPSNGPSCPRWYYLTGGARSRGHLTGTTLKGQLTAHSPVGPFYRGVLGALGACRRCRGGRGGSRTSKTRKSALGCAKQTSMATELKGFQLQATRQVPRYVRRRARARVRAHAHIHTHLGTRAHAKEEQAYAQKIMYALMQFRSKAWMGSCFVLLGGPACISEIGTQGDKLRR